MRPIVDEGALIDLMRRVAREEIARARPPAVPEAFLATRAAAALAGVTPRTVRRWIREGKLQPYGAGAKLRVRRSDLEKLLAGGGERAREDASPEELADRDFDR